MPHSARWVASVSLIATICFVLSSIALLPEHRLQSVTTEIHSTEFSKAQQCSSDKNNNNEYIDWSRFAYVQYATDLPYLCNSVMLFERLHTLKSKAARLLMYPESFSPDHEDVQATLLRKARDLYGVALKPVAIQHKDSQDLTWADSFTKLLAFNQTEYNRILHLDSDSTVLQSMDELFFLPPTPVAMPRAYWEEQPKLGAELILLQPLDHEFDRIKKAISEASGTEYDMEILNALHRDSALVLPHKIYGLLTREFTPQRDTGPEHVKYLGDPTLHWDPDLALRMAKFVHFSDWPLPKPWYEAQHEMIERVQPPCINDTSPGGMPDCRDRDIWLGLREDFKRRRKQVCDIDLL